MKDGEFKPRKSHFDIFNRSNFKIAYRCLYMLFASDVIYSKMPPAPCTDDRENSEKLLHSVQEISNRLESLENTSVNAMSVSMAAKYKYSN